MAPAAASCRHRTLCVTSRRTPANCGRCRAAVAAGCSPAGRCQSYWRSGGGALRSRASHPAGGSRVQRAGARSVCSRASCLEAQRRRLVKQGRGAVSGRGAVTGEAVRAHADRGRLDRQRKIPLGGESKHSHFLTFPYIPISSHAHLLTFQLPHIPTSSHSNFLTFALPHISTSLSSHFLTFPLPHISTSLSSHFLTFPLPYLPTSSHPHFFTFPHSSTAPSLLVTARNTEPFSQPRQQITLLHKCSNVSFREKS